MDCTKEEKKGDVTYYAVAGDQVVYYPTDSLVVMTNKKHFETLAGKDVSKVQISEDLQEISKKMSKGHAWFAISKNVFPEHGEADRHGQDDPTSPTCRATFWNRPRP